MTDREEMIERLKETFTKWGLDRADHREPIEVNADFALETRQPYIKALEDLIVDGEHIFIEYEENCNSPWDGNRCRVCGGFGQIHYKAGKVTSVDEVEHKEGCEYVTAKALIESEGE